jgi:uncharacterized protein YyaL (SSP411 family)
MRDGGFYSTQDADPTPLCSGDDRSESEEGKFFAWTSDELRIAHQALAQMQPMMSQYPLGFGQWLQALDHFCRRS